MGYSVTEKTVENHWDEPGWLVLNPSGNWCVDIIPHNFPSPEAALAFAHLISASSELLAALDGIQWASADKDNMEFSARITYSQMDAIREALTKARAA